MHSKNFEYQPVVAVSRGGIVESVHHGAVAVVDSSGRLIAKYGDPQATTYMRSSAKPFQALPFLESGAKEAFGISAAEVAIVCASHSGTDEHLAVVESLQRKTGIAQTDLKCGIHPPLDPRTARRLHEAGQPITANRHNCSGKHSGMLATARYQDQPMDAYLHPEHPVQKRILEAFCSMVELSSDQVGVGIDGCSAPNFALPLLHAAWGYARLADPSQLPVQRGAACEKIFRAMTSHPFLVGGQRRFDTDLMEATGGCLLSKGGAEGFFAIAIPPGKLSERGIGVAAKIADGDFGRRAGSLLILHVLDSLGALTDTEITRMERYSDRELHNHQDLQVGSIRTCFSLEMMQ